MRIRRAAREERTEHNPSSAVLSGFSNSLLSHAIPYDEHFFSLCLQFFYSLISLVPQELFDEGVMPLWRTQQVAQALGACRCLVRRENVTSQL